MRHGTHTPRRTVGSWKIAGSRLTIGLVFALAVAAIALPAQAAQPAALRNLFRSTATAQQRGSAYTPDQIASAYDMTPLFSRGVDGTGQTIALIELDRFTESEIQAFDSANGLPDPTIQQYYVGGQTFTPPHQGEVAMDVEWAHALAPGATLQVYYIRNNQPDSAGWRSLGQAIDMAVSNGAGTISMSFGACSPTSGYAATQQALARALQHRVSVFVSSGDTGDRPGPARDCGRQLGVAYPASDPSVVAVGGTSLLLNDDDTIANEVAWRLSGGGKAKPLLRPNWQVTRALAPGKFRYAPDVAFVGDPRTGVAVYYNGKWQQAGGTSLGSPAWAAIWSLVRADAARSGKTAGTAPQMVYRIGNSSAYSRVFHDITSGSNGRYQAGPGWDAVTGWGTPDVAALSSTVISLS